MKRNILLSSAVCFSLVFSLNCLAADSHIGRAVKESGTASGHASKAAGHAIAGTGQVASGVSAVPLAIGGSAGAVSNEIAKDLMKAATAPAGAPLEVTDENITVGPPPDKAMESNSKTGTNQTKSDKKQTTDI